MKKILLFVSMLVITSVFFACNKQKTAQEMLEEEKKAIKRFIARKEFVIAEGKDTLRMLEEDTYFRTRDGLYIHVIDSGKGAKAKPRFSQKIVVRYRGWLDIKSDKAGERYENESAEYPPITFLYGNSTTYGNDAYSLSCRGLARVLDFSFIGENAEVSLIIPSDLQSSTRRNLFKPIYFEYVKYRFQ